jgi:hypothetical protein
MDLIFKAFLPTPEQLLPFDEAFCRASPFSCEILIEAFAGKHKYVENRSFLIVQWFFQFISHASDGWPRTRRHVHAKHGALVREFSQQHLSHSTNCA